MKRIAVLASGRGSNFQALIDNIKEGKINGTCVALITDNKEAYAIERAKTAGVPVIIHHFKDYPSKEAYEVDMLASMKKVNADLFVCAGYMRIIGNRIVEAFPGKIMNIHPSLLPSFTGLHAQKQAFDYGVKVAGCTVHFMDTGLDTGPIIVQKAVMVMEDDNDEILADRILEQEHIAYSEAIALFCDNRLKIEGRRVRVLPKQ